MIASKAGYADDQTNLSNDQLSRGPQVDPNAFSTNQIIESFTTPERKIQNSKSTKFVNSSIHVLRVMPAVPEFPLHSEILSFFIPLDLGRRVSE